MLARFEEFAKKTTIVMFKIASVIFAVAFLFLAIMMSFHINRLGIEWVESTFLGDDTKAEQQQDDLVGKCMVTAINRGGGEQFLVIQLKAVFDHQGVETAVFMSISNEPLQLMSIPYEKILQKYSRDPKFIFDCNKTIMLPQQQGI